MKEHRHALYYSGSIDSGSNVNPSLGQKRDQDRMKVKVTNWFATVKDMCMCILISGPSENLYGVIRVHDTNKIDWSQFLSTRLHLQILDQGY
jgi:hypothetical protein